MSRIIEQAGLAVNVNERPPLRVKLPDGSSWPRPAIDADEWCGIGWRCRYAAESITRNDLLTLASIADAYGFLVCGTTQKRREYVTREIRRTLSHDRS